MSSAQLLSGLKSLSFCIFLIKAVNGELMTQPPKNGLALFPPCSSQYQHQKDICLAEPHSRELCSKACVRLCLMNGLIYVLESVFFPHMFSIKRLYHRVGTLNKQTLFISASEHSDTDFQSPWGSLDVIKANELFKPEDCSDFSCSCYFYMKRAL